MNSQLAKKLNTFVRLTTAERAVLVELESNSFRVPAGRELFFQGGPSPVAYILHNGWGCSFKILQGGGRQVITFPIPGDCVGLRSVLLRTLDHSFSAISELVVSTVEVRRLVRVFEKFPYIGAAFMWATSRDEAVTVEHLASIGRRTATERMAHFFLELHDRLTLVGLTEGNEFACPLTQYEIADALGLSAIHVNRVLRDLREAQLMTVQHRTVWIHNRASLKALAGYEDIVEAAVLVREDVANDVPLTML